MNSNGSFAEQARKRDNSIEQHFVDNLKAIMKEKKITRTKLAKMLDMPYTTLCDWCSGRIYPRYEKIEKIASVLNIDPAELAGIELHIDTNYDDDVSNDVAKVTVLKYLPGDTNPRKAPSSLYWFETNIAPELLRNNSYYFGLKVNDNTMAPKLCENDWVIFLQTNKITEDGIYCLRHPGCIAIIRKIVVLKKGFLVIQTNAPWSENKKNIYSETYSLDDIGNKIEIIGKAIRYSISEHNEDL